ncbi:MAG TPA: S8 family serine peptidase [Steroidobacteraceae bacterium]|nr:S8 family serine peptidase [Steroidobacteraceae bacterium]
MKSHQLAIGTLALVATLAARTATTPIRPSLKAFAAPGTAQLHVFGIRAPEQRFQPGDSKLDSALSDLKRRMGTAAASLSPADLQVLSPAARFLQSSADATPMILVDAVTTGDPQSLKAALEELGLQHASVFSNDVSGWLPVDRIQAATARAELHSLRAAMPRARAGAVTTQGDYAQRSDVLRTTYTTLTGSGINVAALSDSYDCFAVFASKGIPTSGGTGYAPNGFTATAANDISSGDLPSAGVTLIPTAANPGEAQCMNGTHYNGYPLQSPFADEGRAMLQIVHDIAPGATLGFHSAEWGEADFANAIKAIATAGAHVIADDVGYFDEPFFQDGIVAQAIDTVEGQGVAYFSAAGNDADIAYDNLAPSMITPGSGPTSGEKLLNFDTSGATTATTLPITIPVMEPGELVAVILQWDQPYVTGAPGSGGATSHLDLCVTGATAPEIVIDLSGNSVSCTGPNSTGSDPNRILIIANPANASGNTTQQTLNVMIGLADGTAAPGRLKLAVDGGGLKVAINQFATNSSTMQGHPNAAGAAAVGAAFFFDTPRCGTSPAKLERYSSLGGTPILFDSSGNRLATAIVRQKPDFVGPDGGNDTFLGFTLASAGLTGSNGQLNTTNDSCQNNPAYPNFFGTSAATPHAAGIAALMLQANPALTPTQIYDALRNTALPMDSPSPSYTSGYGFIQADAALATLPPGPPKLSLAASSVAVNTTTTISWTSINTTGCTASGSWTGSQQTSGSATITAPATAGTATYTLTCSNSHGSNASSVNLTVTAASGGGGGSSGGGGGGGGGGSLEALTLLALLGLAIVREVRRRRVSALN